jgi:methyl-accepting chemotaxis protein
MAIGFAFKLVGTVDFASVIALSIALPLIAHAFAEIADMGELDYNTVLSMGLMLVIMSTAMMLSSWILSYSAKIKPEILFTALAIGFIFTVVAFGVSMMIEALDDAGLKEVLLLGLVMVVVAAAIMISSWLLQYVVPIPFWDVVLASITIGIVAIVMAITLWVVTKLLSLKSTLIGSVMLIVISAAIMISSWILSVGNYENYPSIDWALGVGLSILMLAPAILLIGIPAMVPFVLIGSLMLIVVSAAIMAASLILAQGDYENFPGLDWGLSVGLTMMIFGPLTLMMGFIGILWPIVELGVALMKKIAHTIVDLSNILAEGEYSNAGDMIGWAASVVLLFTVFTPMILMLGFLAMVISVITFFGGDDPMEEGRKLLKKIAWTIVDLSNILSQGTYDTGPTAEWAYAVGYSLTSFMRALAMAQPDDWSWWGGGGTTIEEKVQNLKYAIYAMVGIAKYLGEITGAGVFDPAKAPPKAWAEGVGIAITKFMEALNTANEKSMWDSMMDFFGGDSLGEKFEVLYRVVDTMVNIAWYLNKKSAAFKRGPSKEWAEGVGGGILAFSEAISNLAVGEIMSFFTGKSSNQLLTDVARAMVEVGTILSSNANAFSRGPSKEWVKGMEEMYKSFGKIGDYIGDAGGWFSDPEDIIEMMKTIAQGYVDTGKILSGINETNSPFLTAAKGINALADAFVKFADAATAVSASMSSMSYDAIDMIKGISMSMMALSAVDADNLENVLGKLKPEDVAKMYEMSGKAADESAAKRKKNDGGMFGGLGSWFGFGGGVTKDPNTVEAKRQTQELVKLNKKIDTLNETVSRIAVNTDEMLDVKSSGGGNETKITH